MKEILKNKKNPFSLTSEEKNEYLTKFLKKLSIFHKKNCKEYGKITNNLFGSLKSIDDVYDLPFLPVSIFKGHDLKSISDEDVLRTMTSSGTTGQQVSKIYLDKKTSFNQSKVLGEIVEDFIGKDRMMFTVIDSEDVITNRTSFSARGAGILGFSRFGKGRNFILDQSMELNVDKLLDLCKESRGKMLFFGFTFMVWKHFLLEIEKRKLKVDLSQSILIHGGGWKKLKDIQVTDFEFKERLKKATGIKKVFNYYGMVEQTGSIFFECEYGNLHSSDYSDIILRNKEDLSPIKNKNQEGLIQLLSVLPESYPGHSLLSEDIGIILGEDDCRCNRKGKYFKVLGRVENAEVRGCSDTYTN